MIGTLDGVMVWSWVVTRQIKQIKGHQIKGHNTYLPRPNKIGLKTKGHSVLVKGE